MSEPSPQVERELRQVRLDDDLVAPLLASLGDEYLKRYGVSDELSQTEPTQFDPPGGLFLVMVEDGLVIAGAGYRRISDEVCELKRMWTSPAHRRQGLAGAVLGALEAAAFAEGYRTMRLETGPSQPEAVKLYESRSYHRIAYYGRYARALAFERELDPPAS